jgi:hypothetical protein
MPCRSPERFMGSNGFIGQVSLGLGSGSKPPLGVEPEPEPRAWRRNDVNPPVNPPANDSGGELVAHVEIDEDGGSARETRAA